MFVRYFLELDDPFDRVEAALLADPSTWVPGMARAAGELGERLLTEVGFAVDEDRRMDKEVEISFGEPYRSASATRLPMTWKATGAQRLFPLLEADLEVAGLGATRTQLSISARYRPPMGPLGRVLDRALLHRVAEAALKDFLDRVGAAIATRAHAIADG
jgi:hypothetical protein